MFLTNVPEGNIRESKILSKFCRRRIPHLSYNSLRETVTLSEGLEIMNCSSLISSCTELLLWTNRNRGNFLLGITVRFNKPLLSQLKVVNFEL